MHSQPSIIRISKNLAGNLHQNLRGPWLEISTNSTDREVASPQHRQETVLGMTAQNDYVDVVGVSLGCVD
ncbi:MAG: hypothetical protein QXQ70_07450 [Candidatus Caldarchaeum sp.]